MQVIFRHTSFAEKQGACVDAQKWHSHKISLGYIRTNSNLGLNVTPDGSLYEDGDGYEDGLKRSSDAIVMTSSEVLMLTPD